LRRIHDVEVTATVTAGGLSTDVLASILGNLRVKDIMRSRGVNKKWKEAVKITIVPLTKFIVDKVVVDNVKNYYAVEVMATEMPNLQQLTLCSFHECRHNKKLRSLRPFRSGHKYSDGEDPDGGLTALTANYATHDIDFLSCFSKLRELAIYSDDPVPLNGRYPVLFNFPLLQKLSIKCRYLKWDLEMLSGMPLLKELDCLDNLCLAGNISSLRVLNDTLEKVKIFSCENVEGNFMDLADFPHLKELELEDTAVAGDIRDIGENHFSSLESLNLPETVYGGKGYEFQRISDGPGVTRAVYLLKKQRPELSIWRRHVVLSVDSPDWYDSVDEALDETPPFYIQFVEAGSRIGYRWDTNHDTPCEVNWLDPEPDRESSDYEEYTEAKRNIEEQVTMYRGFHEPPTEEEYLRLWGE
jgi:hypothetical protein